MRNEEASLNARLERVTGAPRANDFMRACYAVCNHGDGTGTIVLDWYETSDGHDYGTSEEFMRAEIERHGSW